ncbi:la-related protein 6 [Cimex lectularius]|uniref:La-related protein 6 n=1 Tax=Cimex lectularius TaxID=79782 RepID=A0A8I6RGK2_CIMLE|nr:la-related protein 6 [Cimex lectularius]
MPSESDSHVEVDVDVDVDKSKPVQHQTIIHSDTKDSLSSVESGPREGDNKSDHGDISDNASDDQPTKPKGEKTSEEENDFVPPDEELVQKIIDQVEFYFSDVNITKDAFLLKHVKRNKEGYVSLKLISSFKRVKHLAKDWRVIAFALAKSKKLEINEAGTKLRRVDPLPAYDQTTPSRTVVAIDLPFEKPTIESVAEMFKSCGEIALIRILRPGNPIPSDVRHFVNKHPEMIGKVSALVEFVRTESAHNAIQKEWSWRQSDIKVIELNAPPSVDRKSKLKKGGNNRSFDLDYSSSCASSSETEDRRLRLQRRCSSPHLVDNHWHQRRWSRDSGTDSSSSYYRSRSNSGVFFMPDVRRMSSDSCSDSYSSRSRSNSGISLSDIRRLSIISKDSDCCCCHMDCSRRSSLANDSGSEGYGSSRSRCNSNASDLRRNSMEFYCAGKMRERKLQDGYWSNSVESGRRPSGPREQDLERFKVRGTDNVVRMPRGPDGGRGFVPAQQACHTLIE